MNRRWFILYMLYFMGIAFEIKEWWNIIILWAFIYYFIIFIIIYIYIHISVIVCICNSFYVNIIDSISINMPILFYQYKWHLHIYLYLFILYFCLSTKWLFYLLIFIWWYIPWCLTMCILTNIIFFNQIANTCTLVTKKV